ncbi:MAG: PAS domain-containing protein [Verrucomicrobiae bacterium]|nr:PAS domain-containing protein [Verrucomicrobiae bacterium]
MSVNSTNPAASPDQTWLSPRWRIGISRGLSVLLLLLGLVTLAGWHLQNDRLTHWRTDWVPMAYNSALAFVFLGAALLALTFDRRLLTRLLAILPLGLGCLTVFQHLSGISLGIDHWMITPQSPVGSQSPTLVALSSGFCFLLTSLAVGLLSQKNLPESCVISINVLSCMVIAIALAAMVGFAQGLAPDQAWGRFNLMAFHTALAFALANVTLLLWLRLKKPPSSERPSPLPAIASGMAVFTVALIFGQTLRNEESQSLRQNCSDAADLAAASWTNQLSYYSSALQFVADVWIAEGPLTQAQFEHLAGLVIKRHPDVQALQWLDPDGIVRWCVPRAGNEAILNQSGIFDDPRRQALEQARNRRRPAVSESLLLKQGGLGFLIYLPLYRQDRYEGALVGVFRYASLAQYNWSRLAGLFEMRLLDMRSRHHLVFPAASASRSVFNGYAQIREIHFEGAYWRLEVIPRRELVQRSLSLLPRLFLGGGAVMGVLTAWFIYIFQTAGLASRELRRANELLQADIVERQHTEQALQEREASLRLAQRVGNVGSWELDLTTQHLLWSDQTYRILGLQADQFVPTRENFYQLVHPEDRDSLRQRITALIHEGGTFDHEFRVLLPDGRVRILHEQAATVLMPQSGTVKIVGVVRDITEMRLAQQERERLIIELQEALDNVKTLSGLLPICANCKKIRDDQGYWNQIEVYLQQHSEARFTHGLCPECVKKLYPELADLKLPGESPPPPSPAS